MRPINTKDQYSHRAKEKEAIAEKPMSSFKAGNNRISFLPNTLNHKQDDKHAQKQDEFYSSSRKGLDHLNN